MKPTFGTCVVIVMTIFSLGAIYGVALSHGGADTPLFTNSATVEDLSRFKASIDKPSTPTGKSPSAMNTNVEHAAKETPAS
jgi:hypothetical protein